VVLAFVVAVAGLVAVPVVLAVPSSPMTFLVMGLACRPVHPLVALVLTLIVVSLAVEEGLSPEVAEAHDQML